MKLSLISPLAFTLILSVWPQTTGICAPQGEVLPHRLTATEAERVIRQRREQSEASERARRTAALDVAAIEERVINRGNGQKVILRRVAPAERVAPVAVAPVGLAESRDGTANRLDEAFFATQEIQNEHISLGAKVYGDEYSEIMWRDPDTTETVSVWTNISLNSLKPIVSFTVDGIHYDYFGFVTTYTREGDDARMKMARQLGYEVESQWKYPPVRLSSDYYEYYVDAPGDAKIPEKLHRQLSALLGFYSANEERFKIEYLNSLTLQATRKADLKSNPPKEAEEIIVNYTPLRGEDAE